jgi:hypothetical protein
MKEFEDILVKRFNLQIVWKDPGDSLNGIYIVGRNDIFEMIIGAPGRIDSEKWVVRLIPHILVEDIFFMFKDYIEDRFDSRDEVIESLTNKSDDVYNILFKYVSGEYAKIVSMEILAENDPEAFDLLTRKNKC